MCAIIFTINNIVLYPGAIPKHQSTNAGLVTYFLQQINDDLISVAGADPGFLLGGGALVSCS